MPYWLMKSEPDELSFDDLLAAPDRTLAWCGVRNYQARNFMRDQMNVGDGVLFYHSSCAVPGVAGLAEVASVAYPDASQFDPASPYFDPKASPATPRWVSRDIRALERGRLVPLTALRAMASLEAMVLLQKGSRLSVSPVSAPEWHAVVAALRAGDGLPGAPSTAR
ncbi:EVE domain-containing protein [Massilia sp. DWR3-1-1]|uniref:EVE domain-containing protein n=1 Tax=Massilia sp. DWR3-1-1 TaxID=2804559 RepID=UPI003CFA8656